MTVVMVPTVEAHALRKRAISALILASVALVAAFLGAPIWDALVALMGALMAWEWARICGRKTISGVGAATIFLAPAVVAAGTIWGMTAALIALCVGLVLTLVAARIMRLPDQLWLAGGVGYVGLPCLALEWIRSDPDHGLETLLWVLAVVWATDTGAYVAGKSIGGPKLAPHISPNKTWAGLAGGSLAALLIGLATAVLLRETPWILAPISAALAVIEQTGDLFESGVKRRFGVKDSSNLIPGHGGVLDRVDGLMAVSLAVAGLSWAAGHTILIWR